MLWRIRGGASSRYSEKQGALGNYSKNAVSFDYLCVLTLGGMLKLVILRSLILGYLPSLFLLQVIEHKRKNFSLSFFSFLVVWFLDETKCVLHADEWYLYLYCIYTWMKITHVLYIHTRDIYTHTVPMCKRYICLYCVYTWTVHIHTCCMYPWKAYMHVPWVHRKDTSTCTVYIWKRTYMCAVYTYEKHIWKKTEVKWLK